MVCLFVFVLSAVPLSLIVFWAQVFYLSDQCSVSHVWLFMTLQTVARQVPRSVGFYRQGYWSGLPFPPPSPHLRRLILRYFILFDVIEMGLFPQFLFMGTHHCHFTELLYFTSTLSPQDLPGWGSCSLKHGRRSWSPPLPSRPGALFPQWRAPALQSLTSESRRISLRPWAERRAGLSQNTWGCWIVGHLKHSKQAGSPPRVDFNSTACQQLLWISVSVCM